VNAQRAEAGDSLHEVDRLYPYDPNAEIEELDGREKCRALADRHLARIVYDATPYIPKQRPQRRRPRPLPDEWSADFPDHKARAAGDKR